MPELISLCLINKYTICKHRIHEYQTDKHFKRKNIKNVFNNNLYQKHENGFSLIEIIIVIAIMSLLISTATPSFNTLINKSRLSKTSEELFSSLSLARSYAITSGQRVHLCALASSDPLLCKKERDFNSNWSDGWMVFADINQNNEYDSNDTMLNISTNSKNINVVFNQRGRLRFFQNGSARSAGFYICSKKSPENRHIKLLYSGRARTTKINNNSQLSTCLSAN